jgi:Ca2+:H+ antiporter
MALIYIAGLYFSLKTHKEIFASSDEIKSAVQKPTITRFWASVILFISICIVAVESELLVTNIQESAIQLGMSQTFIGIIIIAIITNIAEKSIAINFAMKNKLDISIEIGLTSAIQIALFVVPILIIISQIFGYGFFMLFSVFEVVSVMLAVMIINHLAADGKCNWLEGAQLVSVYAILAIVFAFI